MTFQIVHTLNTVPFLNQSKGIWKRRPLNSDLKHVGV